LGAIRKAFDDGYSLTATTKANIKDMDPACNLEANHCYEVLEMHHVCWNYKHASYTLMKDTLCGSEKKQGKQFSEEIVTTLNSMSKVDKGTEGKPGYFWVHHQDLENCFHFVSGCKVLPKYCHSSLYVENSNPANKEFLFKCHAPKGTHAFMSAVRKNLRHFTTSSAEAIKTPYGVSRIVAFQVKNGQEIEI